MDASQLGMPTVVGRPSVLGGHMNAALDIFCVAAGWPLTRQFGPPIQTWNASFAVEATNLADAYGFSPPPTTVTQRDVYETYVEPVFVPEMRRRFDAMSRLFLINCTCNLLTGVYPRISTEGWDRAIYDFDSHALSPELYPRLSQAGLLSPDIARRLLRDHLGAAFMAIMAGGASAEIALAMPLGKIIENARTWRFDPPPSRL